MTLQFVICHKQSQTHLVQAQSQNALPFTNATVYHINQTIILQNNSLTNNLQNLIWLTQRTTKQLQVDDHYKWHLAKCTYRDSIAALLEPLSSMYTPIASLHTSTQQDTYVILASLTTKQLQDKEAYPIQVLQHGTNLSARKHKKTAYSLKSCPRKMKKYLLGNN